MKGEAYASDASTDLELDYELVCQIMDDLEKADGAAKARDYCSIPPKK